MPHAIVAVS